MTAPAQAQPQLPEAGRSQRRTGRRPWLGLLVPALLVFAMLIGLGTWQIQRKAWKEGLIALLTERLAVPPQALPAAAAWPRLDAAQDEYRRVRFTAVFDNAREALVFAAASAFRPDVSGPGYWVFTPARLEDGHVLFVNRGFVPEGRQDARTRAEGEVSGPVEVVGTLRWPPARHWFTPDDDPVHNLWFTPDPTRMAAAKAVDAGGSEIAPFYVEQEGPMPPGGLPQPGRLVVSLPDNHLQYAVTWFGLAAVLAGVFVAYAVTSRGRNGPGEGAAQPGEGRSRSL